MDMSKVFSEYIEKEENYRVAYDIVRRNSKGKIWLIGGALSRNLNQLIHNISQHSFDFDFDFDFDFVVEEGIDDIRLPEGWKIKKNKSGYFRFVAEGVEIDFIPLKEAGFIVRSGLSPTIDNFLLGNPFTIQSMAYDCESKVIIGDRGIKAFKKKVFELNNLEEAKILADKKGVGLNDLILKKAESMGFTGITLSEEFILSKDILKKEWDNKADERWNKL